MAKITELPALAPEQIDGTETSIVVKNGQTVQSPTVTLFAPHVARAQAAETGANQAAAKAALINAFVLGDRRLYLSAPASPAYNGTAGSGFTTVPVDPVRQTAKPALHFVTVPFQAFTDNMVVGVYAGANNKGDLADNGIEKVIFHVEGRATEALSPSFYNYTDINGVPKWVYGWFVDVPHPGVNGEMRIYAEAVPKDTTMQRRVSGPYTVFPSATLYDFDVTVAPSGGGTYTSILAAMNAIRLGTYKRPRIRVIEAGTYDLPAMSQGYLVAGWCVLEATVPITIGKTSGTDALRPRLDHLWIRGQNITMDRRFISAFTPNNAGTPNRLDGIIVTDSGGRDSLWLGGTKNSGIMSSGYVTDCDIRVGGGNCLNGTLLALNNKVRGLYWDVITGARCVIGNDFGDYSNAFFRQNVDAFTLAYTGTEATASLSATGTNDGTPRALTAKWGTNSATFNADSRAVVPITASAFKAWIEGLGVGFACTVLDDTRRISAIGRQNSIGTNFTDQNVKSAPYTFTTFFDVHGDFYQQTPGTVSENVVVADNTAVLSNTQNFFFTGDALRDFWFVNNAIYNGPGDGTVFSQFSKPQSHVVVAHNSFPRQTLYLDTGSTFSHDPYCLIACNAFASITWSPTIQPPAAQIVDNHLHAGSIPPSVAIGTTVGGDYLTNYGNAVAGVFAPRGALLTSPKAVIKRHDREGRLRPSLAPAGALG